MGAVLSLACTTDVSIVTDACMRRLPADPHHRRRAGRQQPCGLLQVQQGREEAAAEHDGQHGDERDDERGHGAAASRDSARVGRARRRTAWCEGTRPRLCVCAVCAQQQHGHATLSVSNAVTGAAAWPSHCGALLQCSHTRRNSLLPLAMRMHAHMLSAHALLHQSINARPPDGRTVSQRVHAHPRCRPSARAKMARG